MDFAKVELNTSDVVLDGEPVSPTYSFTYTKTIQDINGIDFEVVDRVEEYTIDQLNQNLASLQDQIVKVQAMIDAAKGVK